MFLKNKLLIRFAQTVFAIFLVSYLLSLLDFKSVKALIDNGLLNQLWPGPFILMLGLVLAAERWRQILLCFDQVLSITQAFLMYLVGAFYGVLLPGVLGGDIARIALCKRKTGGSTYSIAGSIALERGLGLWGLAFLGSIGAIFVFVLMSDEVVFFTLLIAPSLTISVPIIFLMVPFFFNSIKRMKGSSSIIQRIFEIFVRMRASFTKLPSSLIFRTMILSTAFQATEIVIYYYFGRVLGLDIPFAFYLFVIPLVYLATLIPISLGGVGVREGVLVWFLTIAGISASDAVLLAFLVYLNRVVVSVIGGIVHAVNSFEN